MPSEYEVAETLGNTAVMWNEVKRYIEEYGTVAEEWRFYTKKAGWCKKILLVSGKEERNIVFIYPNVDIFTCILVYGEKAVAMAQKSELPEKVMESILLAKAYKEGRSFQIEVRESKDLDILKKLIEIKIASA